MYRFLQSLILRAGALKAAVMAAVATAAVVAGSAGLLVYLMHVTAVTEHHLQIGEVFAITLATAVVCLVIALPSFTLIDERLRKESELERLIEELRITQDRLSASENRFRHIAESASDWFCEMDADLRFTYFSPRAEEVVGVPVAFHLGKTRAELAGEDVATEKWQRHLDDLENHRPFRDFQFVRKGHDGRLQTLSTSGKPLFDADGAFTGYIGVGSDITPQLEAEETARLAQERLAHAIDQLSELFVLWGPDDRLVMCNEQFRRVNAAIQEATVPGTLFADHIRAGLDAGLYSGVRGHETDWLAERLQRHRNPGEPFELERHDGLWLYVHEQPFPDGSIATISIDITARKSAEREMMAAKESAEAANRSKSDFLARMSHELRTPLNAIIGFSQIIHGETLGPVGTPAYKSYAEDILTSGELLLSLINDLLDLSRIEAGKYEINDDLVDLGDVAADMMRMFGGDAQAGKLALDILIPADMPKLRADPRAFRQVLMNLISNAVKVTPRGDRITVEADIVDDGLRVRVTDTGRGFSEAEMDTVLAPFGRLDQADTASVAGTGLGLPIVKSLMDLHDGTLALRSRPGAGTTATVVFPAARVDASPQQAAMSF